MQSKNKIKENAIKENFWITPLPLTQLKKNPEDNMLNRIRKQNFLHVI